MEGKRPIKPKMSKFENANRRTPIHVFRPNLIEIVPPEVPEIVRCLGDKNTRFWASCEDIFGAPTLPETPTGRDRARQPEQEWYCTGQAVPGTARVGCGTALNGPVRARAEPYMVDILHKFKLPMLYDVVR